MKRLRYEHGDEPLIRKAIELLREARGLLAGGGAPKAADKVRRALKSAEGAHRHAFHRMRRRAIEPGACGACSGTGRWFSNTGTWSNTCSCCNGTGKEVKS